MKILFVSSGNNAHFRVVPFIKAQAESIKEHGIIVEHYPIMGKGIIGYLKNVKPLRKYIKDNDIDVVHAHYSFNGLVVLLTGLKMPIVVSFMGSDTYGDFDKNGKRIFSSYINILISKVIQPFIDQIIVKSPNLAKYIYARSKLHIIPNGVNMERFKPIERNNAINYLALNPDKRYVLFLGDTKNERKNFRLAKQAFKDAQLGDTIELLTPYPVPQDELNFYYNVADIIILTSFNEGSPNVIKEAMATNCPIVSTNVGDVAWLFDKEPGHFIAENDAEKFAVRIKAAVHFIDKYKETKGRDRILKLELDSRSVAKKIISIYSKVFLSDAES